MSTGKTYSTKYLLDSNNNRGAEGQVLSTTSTGIDWVDSGTLSTGLWLKNGNNIYNSNSGNVGVGTTGPTAKLHVLGGSNDTIDETTANFKVQGGGGNGTMFGTIASSPYTSYIQSAYVVDTSLAQYNLALNPIGGNVGIGTTLPGEKLHVIGNVFLNAGSAYIASYNNTNNYQASMRWAGLQLGNNGTNRIVAGRTNTGGGFQFWTNNTNDASDHTVTPDGIMTMAMTNAGNVGIGTTLPTTALTIRKSISPTAYGGEASMIEFKSYYTGYDTETVKSAIYSGVSDQTGLQTARGFMSFWTSSYSATGVENLTEKMRIESDGNVGIGTISPNTYSNQTTLTINGSTYGRIDLESGGTLRSSLFSQAANTSLTVDTGFFSLDTGGSERMRITSTGNVGIGATNPLRKLHVVGQLAVNNATTEYYGVLMSGGEGADPSVLIGDWHNSSGTIKWDSTGSYLRIDSQHSTANAAILFSGNDGSTEYMRIASTGNVGIGITNPILKLHIEGTNSLPATSGIAQNGGIRIENGVNNGVLDIGASNATGAPGWLQATDKADLSQAYKLLLNPNGGDVGIGTTSPSDALEVAGNNSTQHRIRINNAGTGTATLAFMQGATFKSWVEYNNSTGNFDVWQYTNNPLRFATNNIERMRIDSSGNVGIGTTSPGAKLEVGANVAKGVLINRTFTTSSQTLANVRAYYGLAITPLRTGTGGLYFTNYDADTPIIQSVNTSNVAQFLLLNPFGGNVGIGTTSPNAPLQFSNAITTRKVVLYEMANNNNQFYGFGVEAARLVYSTANTGDDHVFYAGASSTSRNELIRIDGSNGDIKLSPSSRIILDDTPTASTASGSGTIVKWSVSDTTTAGTLYTVKTNGLWTPVDADNEATSIGMLAIALGSNATDGMLLQGFFYKASHGFTIGLPLYISNTAGAFTTTRPTGTNDYVRIIGYATSANYIYFDPDKTWVQVA